jgi:hypothetical protein
MKSSFSLSIILASAAIVALNVPTAEAGGFKHGRGHHHFARGVSTYLTEDLDETAQDPGAPGTMWAGTGIGAANFIIRQYENAGIELAMKGHLRQGPDVPPTYVDDDGLIHVEVPTGSQPGVPGRAAWNFAYSYDVALDPGNPDLEDYRGYLLIDIDPTDKTDYLKLRLEKLTDTPTGQHNGYGWVYLGTEVIPDDEGTSQVSQNSQNMAFYDDVIDADPDTPGQQSYVDSGYGPAEFDVIMALKRGHRHQEAELHVVFDVVDP